jgi:hypothetical protein
MFGYLKKIKKRHSANETVKIPITEKMLIDTLKFKRISIQTSEKNVKIVDGMYEKNETKSEGKVVFVLETDETFELDLKLQNGVWMPKNVYQINGDEKVPVLNWQPHIHYLFKKIKEYSPNKKQG